MSKYKYVWADHIFFSLVSHKNKACLDMCKVRRKRMGVGEHIAQKVRNPFERGCARVARWGSAPENEDWVVGRRVP